MTTVKQASRSAIHRWSRHWPPIAGTALGLSSIVEAALRADGVTVFMPLAILVGVCATAPLAFARAHAVAAAITITTATALTALLYHPPAVTGMTALTCIWTVICWRRTRAARTMSAERRASRQAIEESLMEFTARGERARIARELHDVVAHHISMISVQAETARMTIPGMPPEGARQLRAIGDTARTALTEMRRLLGVLREDSGAPPTRRPQPGLQQLLELIDENRETGGASTRLIVRGHIVALDPGIELTAYRIVQEALTNTRRHAPGAAVDVELDYAKEYLHVLVRDNGPGPPATAGAGGNSPRSHTTGGPGGKVPGSRTSAGSGGYGPGSAASGGTGDNGPAPHAAVGTDSERPGPNIATGIDHHGARLRTTKGTDDNAPSANHEGPSGRSSSGKDARTDARDGGRTGAREAAPVGLREGVRTSQRERVRDAWRKGVRTGLRKGVRDAWREGARTGLREGARTGLREGVRDAWREGARTGLRKGVRDAWRESVRTGQRENVRDAWREGARTGLREGVRDVWWDGPGDGGGHGLLGMRERVAAVGGELRVGPAPVNGFLLEATLPVSGRGAAAS
jgi:signal transduction histidine kinase